MKRWLTIGTVTHVVAWLVFLNFTNSFKYVPRLESPKVMAYFVVHVIILIVYMVWALRTWNSPEGLLRSLWEHVKDMRIPRLPKYIFMVILVIEAFHIGIGKTNYPFADVGMFRYAAAPGKLYDSIVTLPKYYYLDNYEPRIVELRKQHLWLFSDVLTGFGYNNEYTFSAAYHYKGHRKNFEMLSGLLREREGVDTLWVGLHNVNFRTGDVWFDPDLSCAIGFNDTAKLFYGPIYIPDYQRKRVSDGK